MTMGMTSKNDEETTKGFSNGKLFQDIALKSLTIYLLDQHIKSQKNRLKKGDGGLMTALCENVICASVKM